MKKLLIIIILLLSTNCFAVTGNDLHVWLKSNNDYEKGSAHYFIIGVMQSMESYRETEISIAKSEKRKPKLGYYACLPKGITIGQLFDMVQKYLDDNPEKRHEQGQMLVLNAFKVWNCAA